MNECKIIVLLLSSHSHASTSLLLAFDKTHFKLHVQTDALTPNNAGSFIVRLHVAKSVTGFKLCATTPSNTQQHETGCAN